MRVAFAVTQTPRRDILWEAQTPQGFRKDIILEAYGLAKDDGVTDDYSAYIIITVSNFSVSNLCNDLLYGVIRFRLYQNWQQAI